MYGETANKGTNQVISDTDKCLEESKTGDMTKKKKPSLVFKIVIFFFNGNKFTWFKIQRVQNGVK